MCRLVWYPSFGYKMRAGNTVIDHQNIKMLEDTMTNSKQNSVKSSKLGAVTQCGSHGLLHFRVHFDRKMHTFLIQIELHPRLNRCSE
jgi:hypothetical protein